jgi:hypothetical protein
MIFGSRQVTFGWSEGERKMTEPSQKRSYRAAVVLALVTCLLTVWTTVVRDDGTGGTYFMLIMAVGVGWFAARFQPAGMMRTMLGVAAMQAVNGLLVATAPVTASLPGGASRAALFNALFTGLWLGSAALFRLASRDGHQALAN